MSALPFGVRYMKAQAPYYEELGSITGISYDTGRRYITSNWSGSTATVYGRNPSNITNPPVIGQSVLIYYNNDTLQLMPGYVSDWRIIYGMKPSMDTWELSIESGWAVAGRKTATGASAITTTAGANTLVFARQIGTAAGNTDLGPIKVPNAGSAADFGFSSTTSAQTYDGQIANAATALMQTEQGFIRDVWTSTGLNVGVAATSLWGKNATNAAGNVGLFTDGAAGLYEFNYTAIEFLSAASNYATKVVVNASGFATQTSGTGDYSQNYSTINGSASEASNLAGYIKAELDLSTAVPYAITTTSAATLPSVSSQPVALARSENVHNYCTISFRGVTYACVIEGISFTATPDAWSMTYYLSSSLQNAFLRLDNPVFGTLDNNRLGF